jgi:integrase
MHAKDRSPLRERVERGIYKRKTRDGRVRYEVAFVNVDGKQRWRTVPRLQEARDLRDELRATVNRGEVVPAAKTTFAEIAEQWYDAKAPRVRRRTAAYYRDALDHVLLPRFGRLRLGVIDADAIAQLTRELEHEGLHAIDPARPVRPLGWSSVTNYLKPLRGVLSLGVRRRLIASTPFAVLTSDERPHRGAKAERHEWSDEDVAALLAASRSLAREAVAKYDYSSLLRLVATLGLRKGEALGLRWRDFEKEGGYLYVREQWTADGEYAPPKTAAGVRRIALPATTRDELIALRLRSGHSRDDDPVFSSRTGTPLGHRNVTRRGFEPARDKAGLPASLTFHDLRHAAASRLVRSGLDPVTVAAVLGHEDPNTTLKVYAHLFDRRRTDEAVRAALSG